MRALRIIQLKVRHDHCRRLIPLEAPKRLRGDVAQREMRRAVLAELAREFAQAVGPMAIPRSRTFQSASELAGGLPHGVSHVTSQQIWPVLGNKCARELLASAAQLFDPLAGHRREVRWVVEGICSRNKVIRWKP